MGIVVIGAVFVDIKGYPLSTYIPGGRNAGRIEQVHGGVSRNVVEDIANVELRPTFVGLVDEVVIARGDLGNAMPLWELPRCQKQLSAACRAAGVPFMVVTQMLDSMHTRAVPTRAEVSDIYNAVLDGASSLMLTGETAAGQYPVQAMEYLVRTARTAM